MKIKYKTLSINHIFLIITLVMWCWTIGSASAEECLDLIVDGEDVTVDGGCYGIIFVKYDGKLTINGDTTAQEILLRWGTITVNGNMDVADKVTVEQQGILNLCGNWFVGDMRINGGLVYVIPYSDSLEGSGTFFLECDQLTIEADGAINANGTGGDIRGIGVDGHGSGGGSYGGKGGDGERGAGGNIYGDNFSLTIDMGSRGGNDGEFKGGKGGGSISIISKQDIAIHGTITANGSASGPYCGGGSGGGVLILSGRNVEIAGTITANGYDGQAWGGGGGGGRIKLFYEIGLNINDLADKLSVNAGNGYNWGQKGTIWTNAIPLAPELIAPEDGALLATYRPTFRFNVIDTSVNTDNRDDDLSCIIELSTDNFATIYKTYDQNVSVQGWSKVDYKSGDVAEFTPTEDLPAGVYQWRVAARDKNLRGDNSLIQSFTLGTPPLIRVEAYPSSLPPDGKSTSLITATVTSPEGKPITDEIIEMSVDDGGKISEVTNNSDGTYTATYTAGDKTGTVTITAKATKSNVSDTVELMLTSPVIYQTELSLTKGINTISLPLNTEPPYTASTLASTLNATIVIQVEDGHFDAYVHRGSIGNDFEIQMGKGYIVNLMEALNFEITGKPWGEPVPAAPSTSTPVEPWAFVIAGWVEGEVPQGSQLRATNLHTKESITVPISSSGQFTAAVVDMNRRPVIAEGDEFTIQLIGMGGVSLTEAKRYIISYKELEQAYLLAGISAKIEHTKLLQNYPNPFNPETWIPYKLASDVAVRIAIYDIKGALVRQLSLGYQKSGYYVDRLKAAYWDGRNASGELVASGIYFYQLTAGDFIATRRMVILK